jgi:hypothetical protein
MTEGKGGSGDAKDNVRDEFGEATERRRTGKDASKDAVEKEEQSGGGSGGVKDNVKDDWDESQRR